MAVKGGALIHVVTDSVWFFCFVCLFVSETKSPEMKAGVNLLHFSMTFLCARIPKPYVILATYCRASPFYQSISSRMVLFNTDQDLTRNHPGAFLSQHLQRRASQLIFFCHCFYHVLNHSFIQTALIMLLSSLQWPVSYPDQAMVWVFCVIFFFLGNMNNQW